MRVLSLLVVLAACNKSAGPTPSVEATVAPVEQQARTVATAEAEKPRTEVGDDKESIPVVIVPALGAERSGFTLTFPSGGENISLRAYGASGLVVEGEEVGWAQDVVEPATVHTLEVVHRESGDLAIWMRGTFNGTTVEEVRSFTIGNRQPTTVPTETVGGVKTKGWDATAN